MNYNDIWCNLKDSHRGKQFAEAVEAYLGYMVEKKLIHSWTLHRRKFGFGPAELGEFHIQIAFDDLAQMDEAFFAVVDEDDKELMKRHVPVYSMVKDFKSALYRDFPDKR